MKRDDRLSCGSGLQALGQEPRWLWLASRSSVGRSLALASILLVVLWAQRSSAAAANLLRNPSFEAGAPFASGTNGQTGSAFDWLYYFSGGMSYIWPQTKSPDYMPLAPVETRTGDESVRIASRQGGQVILYQDVPIRPGAKYTASVWVRAIDADGMGFGTSPGDRAGLVICEMDADGRATGQHESHILTRASTAFQRLDVAFRSAEGTHRARFSLVTSLRCNYWHGMVKYDDCQLDGPPASGTSRQESEP